MTVATFLQPDYNTQTGTGYPLAIDAAIAVHSRIVGAFAPHAQSTPDMTVRVDAGALQIGATLTEVAAQSTGAITAPATNPRWDIVYIDNATGAVGVATGTEAASPADPAIPAGKTAIARVRLAVSTAAIANALLDDLRPPAGPALPAASQAEAEAGTGTAPREWTPQRVAQAIAALSPAADQTARDIGMTALIAATSTGGVRGPVASWVANADNFTVKTNATFATDHYHNPGTTTTNSASSEWAGATSDFTFTGTNIVDVTADRAIKSVASFAGDFTFQFNVHAATGSRIGFYLAANDASFNQNLPTGGVDALAGTFDYYVTGDCRVAGVSEATVAWAAGDTIKWERVGSTVKLYKNGALARTMTATSTGTVRFFIGTGSTASPDLRSVSWTVPGAPLDMTLSDDAETITTGAQTVDVYVTEKTVDANPTRRVRASIDGGTTWSAAGTLQETFSYPNGKNIHRYSCNVAAQTGTSLKVEYNTLNDGKEREVYRLDAAALYP